MNLIKIYICYEKLISLKLNNNNHNNNNNKLKLHDVSTHCN